MLSNAAVSAGETAFFRFYFRENGDKVSLSVIYFIMLPERPADIQQSERGPFEC